MPGNINPIYSRVPHTDTVQSNNAGLIAGPTANTAQDGSGSAMYPLFHADLTNGSYVQSINFRSVGSPAATVARLFVCRATGAFTPGTTNTSTNTTLFKEYQLAAQTLSQTIQSNDLEFPLNLGLDPGFWLCVAFGTSTGAAGTGYGVMAKGGDY